MTEDRDRLAFYARMELVAGRHEDTMKKFAESYEMTSKERDLFYMSFKGQFDQRRESLQNLNKHLENAKSKNDQLHMNVINEIKNKIRKEVLTITSDIVKYLNERLIIDRSCSEKNLFPFTMKGDFYSYMYEVSPDEQVKKMVISAYESAKKISDTFTETNVAELNLYYNYASFQYKQLKDSSSAMILVNSAIVKVNEVLKCSPTIEMDDLKFMREELFKLCNKIDRASPFMNTQQEAEMLFPISPQMFDSSSEEFDLEFFNDFTQQDIIFNNNFFE